MTLALVNKLAKFGFLMKKKQFFMPFFSFCLPFLLFVFLEKKNIAQHNYV